LGRGARSNGQKGAGKGDQDQRAKQTICFHRLSPLLSLPDGGPAPWSSDVRPSGPDFAGSPETSVRRQRRRTIGALLRFDCKRSFMRRNG
jgi:hypothetical protein